MTTGHFNETHGMTKTSEFNTWNHMLGRCLNPSNKSFVHYGGRGIKVCERWLKFENFFADMGTRPSDIHSIDREDVNGNYEPSNCRWATPIEQASNTRRNVFLTIDGEPVTVAEASRRLGVPRETLKSRLTRGFSKGECVTAPFRKITETSRGEKIEHDGKRLTASEWALITGVQLKTLLYRLKAGWTPSKALTTPVRQLTKV